MDNRELRLQRQIARRQAALRHIVDRLDKKAFAVTPQNARSVAVNASDTVFVSPAASATRWNALSSRTGAIDAQASH